MCVREVSVEGQGAGRVLGRQAAKLASCLASTSPNSLSQCREANAGRSSRRILLPELLPMA